MRHANLNLVLSVTQCPVCGLSHDFVKFIPYHAGCYTHRGECPSVATWGNRWIMLDTQRHPGVWDRYLRAGGL